MVTTEYHGRLGNNMFQYTFARLLADLNGLPHVLSWPHGDMISPTPANQVIDAECLDVEKVIINDLYRARHNVDFFATPYSGRVHCRGFFQDHRLYDNHKDLVRSYWRVPEAPKQDGVVMHLRLGDYATRKVDSVPHPTWVTTALAHLGHRSGEPFYVVTDEPDSAYLDLISKHNPIVISGSMADDFWFINRASRAICSPSSFCWWALYLGNPEKVISFPRWMRFSPYINLGHTKGFIPIPGAYLSCSALERQKRIGLLNRAKSKLSSPEFSPGTTEDGLQTLGPVTDSRQ